MSIAIRLLALEAQVKELTKRLAKLETTLPVRGTQTGSPVRGTQTGKKPSKPAKKK